MFVLPKDLFENILSFLPNKDLVSFVQTSKKFRTENNWREYLYDRADPSDRVLLYGFYSDWERLTELKSSPQLLEPILHTVENKELSYRLLSWGACTGVNMDSQLSGLRKTFLGIQEQDLYRRIISYNPGRGIVQYPNSVAFGIKANMKNGVRNSISLGTGSFALDDGDLALGSFYHPLKIINDQDKTYLHVIVNGRRGRIPIEFID